MIKNETLNIALPDGILDGPKKLTVIRLRWLVIITCAYLLLTTPTNFLSTTLLHVSVLLYIATDVCLYFVNDAAFNSSYFYSPIVVFDTLAITASLVMTHQVETDFYLAYFLVIILCAVWKDLRWSVTITALIALVYGYLLFSAVERATSSIFLRV